MRSAAARSPTSRRYARKPTSTPASRLSKTAGINPRARACSRSPRTSSTPCRLRHDQDASVAQLLSAVFVTTFATALAAAGGINAAAAQGGNPEQGAHDFAVCSACHQVGPNAKNGVGPVLNGIISGKAGGFHATRTRLRTRIPASPGPWPS